MTHLAPTSSNWLHWLQQGNRPVFAVVLLTLVAIAATAVIHQIPERETCVLFEDGNISKSERNQILVALGSAGLSDYKIKNGQICVPVEVQAAYLAAIAEKQAMPRAWSTEKEFQPNPFVPRSQQEIMARDRRKLHLRDMIERLPYVAEAWLELDWAASQKMFEPDRQSAVVMVRPTGQALDRQQVDSIQELVTFLIAGLERRNVAVVDTNIGITYQQDHNGEQNKLIELVNWTMRRREHYHQQLSELENDYPGIEIDVEVQQATEIENGTPANKLAAEKPDKLAARISVVTPIRNEPVRVGLNSAATVTPRDQVPQPDPPTVSEVVQVNYEEPRQQLPARLPTVNPRPDQLARANSNSGEVVRVTVRVPQALLATMTPPPEIEGEHDVPTTDAQRFEYVKTGIQTRIRELIPESSLAISRPITVLLVGAPAGEGVNGYESMVNALRLYWPIGAVLLLSILLAAFSRTQSVAPQPAAATPMASLSAEQSEKHLQQQLANLIDSDPATAAKIIKNWIRQTG